MDVVVGFRYDSKDDTALRLVKTRKYLEELTNDFGYVAEIVENDPVVVSFKFVDVTDINGEDADACIEFLTQDLRAVDADAMIEDAYQV